MTLGWVIQREDGELLNVSTSLRLASITRVSAVHFFSRWTPPSGESWRVCALRTTWEYP